MKSERIAAEFETYRGVCKCEEEPTVDPVRWVGDVK
jgi:hypothetical protein